MIKKRFLLIPIVVIVILIICLVLYKYLLNKPYLNNKDIDRISITLTQSSSVNNVELNAEDIQAFISLYNKYDFRPIIHSNDKGLEILVHIIGSQDHTISFQGKYIKVVSGIIYNRQILNMFIYM